MPEKINDLSIVCATHNAGIKLSETLKNISFSSVYPEEIIICTTNCEDKNFIDAEIINKLNIKFIRSTIKSQTLQRNLAIQQSIGSVILQIDDDVKIDKFAIKKLYSHFQNNSNNKKVVGGYLIYPDKNHVSYKFNNLYDKSIFVRSIYLILNLGKEVRDMSIIASGRFVPKLKMEESKELQWLSSFIMYSKSALKDSKIIEIEGKGYF